MSKCQRTKLFAGGKAGAGGGYSGGGSSGPNNLGSDMAALLAARDAQDRAWTTPAADFVSKPIGTSSGPEVQKATPALSQLAIVTTAAPANQKQMSKEEMMKIICSGDMSDDE